MLVTWMFPRKGLTPAGAGQRSDQHRLRTINEVIVEVVLETLPLTFSVLDTKITSNSLCHLKLRP